MARHLARDSARRPVGPPAPQSGTVRLPSKPSVSGIPGATTARSDSASSRASRILRPIRRAASVTPSAAVRGPGQTGPLVPQALPLRRRPPLGLSGTTPHPTSPMCTDAPQRATPAAGCPWRRLPVRSQRRTPEPQLGSAKHRGRQKRPRRGLGLPPAHQGAEGMPDGRVAAIAPGHPGPWREGERSTTTLTQQKAGRRIRPVTRRRPPRALLNRDPGRSA